MQPVKTSAICRLLTALGIFSLIWLRPSVGMAFYDWQRDDKGLEFLGFLTLGFTVASNPDSALFYDDPTSVTGNGGLRLLLHGRQGDTLRYGVNILQVGRISSSSPSPLLTSLNSEPERSGSLTWQQPGNGNRLSFLTLDNISLQVLSENVDVTIGRQPVNLATTFYFTPNDFFAPFAPQTFYRTYKPGVDGIRADIRLAELSLLSIIGVLGYKEDKGSDNGWSSGPDWNRGSLLARLAVNRLGFEWGLLGGLVRNDTVLGGFLQGELFDWLGIRTEGHYTATGSSPADDTAEITIGLEHRFPSSLNLQLEQFYHGRGYTAIAEANRALQSGITASSYLGRHYTALGASYQFSPLLVGQMLGVVNWSDHSGLLAFNSVYSLADEAEFSTAITLPVGSRPNGSRMESEYGLLPVTATIEYRFYF